tara:strand:+ start:350 stop:1024 length:675 start_codon:yes stop_codon:yes gene_type:complete
MTSYDFVEQKIVKPLSNDMFITGLELATMLRNLENSSRLTRFAFGAKIGMFLMRSEDSWGEMTLEDTSRLDSDWRTAWDLGLKRLELIPTGQRSNAGNWSLQVAGVFAEEATPPRISWNTDYLDVDELISSSAERGILLEDNPWFVIEDATGEYIQRNFSGEILTPHPIINEKIANELHNHFRVSFSYIMREVEEYGGRDLKETYNFYFELRTSPTLNYPTGGI